ncbi:putative DD41D transposase [Trichonephila clavipes]|nr:putative DD41D transposase [Trichonephila clavipes]
MGPKRDCVVPDFHKRILFSDEAHFWLNGYANIQNCRIWNEANPQVYVETPLHPEKLTVWCALWAGGIIGPYFFKNDEGCNEVWFQQDGATARATIDLLKDTFGDRIISRFGPVNWPPRSCDLTPLDYFLWGYVKSLVYADKPQTLDHLEDNIRRVIADIRPRMLEKVIESWTSRLDYLRASRVNVTVLTKWLWSRTCGLGVTSSSPSAIKVPPCREFYTAGVKSLEAPSPPIGVMGNCGKKGGRECQVRGVVVVTLPRYKMTRSVSNRQRVGL